MASTQRLPNALRNITLRKSKVYCLLKGNTGRWASCSFYFEPEEHSGGSDDGAGHCGGRLGGSDGVADDNL